MPVAAIAFPYPVCPLFFRAGIEEFPWVTADLFWRRAHARVRGSVNLVLLARRLGANLTAVARVIWQGGLLTKSSNAASV